MKGKPILINGLKLSQISKNTGININTLKARVRYNPDITYDDLIRPLRRQELHGYTVTYPKLCGIWSSMKQRCDNPNDPSYHNYGARGIKVCDEWQSCNMFCQWMILNGYTENTKLELDRKENDKHYCPENCRLTTHTNNNRNTRRNHVLTINNITKCITEWSELINISRSTIYTWTRKSDSYAIQRIREFL